MAQIPPAASGLVCPLHQKDMSKVCHKCPLWVQLRGKNPQTGAEVDEWNCSLATLPMLLVENSRSTRSVASATESFRNEMTKAHQQASALVLALASDTRPAVPLLEG